MTKSEAYAALEEAIANVALHEAEDEGETVGVLGPYVVVVGETTIQPDGSLEYAVWRIDKDGELPIWDVEGLLSRALKNLDAQ